MLGIFNGITVIDAYANRPFATWLTVKRDFVLSEIGAMRRSQKGQSRA